jgi:5-methylcytosine-specific restriction endonuclease McrA
MLRKYMLVDLFSGSYTSKNVAHEILNDKKNPVTGKYYGYLPPHDNPNISKLGASRTDSFVDDILVVFARKISEDSTDRRIIGFYPSARIYGEKQSGEVLDRRIREKDGSEKIVSYTMESDEYYPVLPEYSLVIETRKYKSHMFRGQRIYGGTYPQLDLIVFDYIERLKIGKELEDDILTQQELQEISGASNHAIRNAPNRKVLFENQLSGSRVLRNPQLVKSAIIAADYQCEANSEHITFLNRHGKPYMEGHHLIPCTVKNAKEIWEKFGKNIDCTENIVSLCPTCHRAIHMGNRDEKRRVLAKIISKRLPILNRIGINLNEEYINHLYEVD